MGVTKLFGIIWILKTIIDVLASMYYFKLKRRWKNNNIGFDWLLGLGMGHGMMIFLIIIVFMFPDNYWILLLPFTAVVVEIVFLTVDISEKIFYDEKYFCLGFDVLKKIKYEYGEIYSCCIGRNVCAIGVGTYERELRKSGASEKFINFAIDKYQEIYEKDPPSCTRIGKKDPFSGKLERPGDFISNCRVLLITVVVFIAIFAGTLTEQFLVEEDDVRYSEEIIVECYEPYPADDEPVYFWTQNPKFEDKKRTFKIMPVRDTGILSQEIYDAMREERTMYVYYDTNAKGSSPFRVYDLRDDHGKIYCTFEETNAYFLRENIDDLIILLFILLGAVGYYFYYIDTVKHPEKYSENVKSRVAYIAEKYKI